MPELWSWLYTDGSGKRRIYPSKLSVEDGKRLKEATPINGTLEVSDELVSTSGARGIDGPAMQNVADLMTGLERAILIVTCLRPVAKNAGPEMRTLLAELSNELAGARMHLARLRAILVGLDEKEV